MSNKFVYINDAMNSAQMEAVEKARVLGTNKLALIESARDTENAIDVWVIVGYEITRFKPTESMDAVLSHDVVIIEEGAVSDKTIERLRGYATVVE